MQKSEGADTEGRVAVGESERLGGFKELAATEEAIAVGELNVVLNAALLKRRREVCSGSFRPPLNWIGEAVVHLEAEDATVMARAVGAAN